MDQFRLKQAYSVLHRLSWTQTDLKSISVFLGLIQARTVFVRPTQAQTDLSGPKQTFLELDRFKRDANIYYSEISPK